MRDAGLDAEQQYTHAFLSHLEAQTDLDEQEYTNDDLKHDLNWMILHGPYGNFSGEAYPFINRIPFATWEIPIIRSATPNVPCFLVYGIVHDLVVEVSIYMTQTYRNVIGIAVPLTPDRSTTFHTINIDTLEKFLESYFDKTPITVVLDDSDGCDTEAN